MIQMAEEEKDKEVQPGLEADGKGEDEDDE